MFAMQRENPEEQNGVSEVQNQSVESIESNNEIVYGKFTTDDEAQAAVKDRKGSKDPFNADVDSETGLETLKENSQSDSPSKSHTSLLGYTKPNDEHTEEEQKGNQSRDSAASTVSFDTWAFAISDSRTVAKKPQNQSTCPKKDEASMKSSEIRRAEELCSDWLADKKIVRFNLDKNEVYTQQAQVDPDGMVVASQASPKKLPLSQKTESSTDTVLTADNSALLEKVSSKASTVEDSQPTNFYDSQDTQATSLFVTQITNMLKRGNRKRTLQQYHQTAGSGTDDDDDRPQKKNLQVLVSASDRLKATEFKGVIAASPMTNTDKPIKKRSIRPNKNHLKFPLYLDEQIGFANEEAQVRRKSKGSDVVSATENLHDAVSIIHNESLFISLTYSLCFFKQSADEDYETDTEILRKTIHVCKKDCFQALKRVLDNPKTFQQSLHNNKYQRYFLK